MPRRKFDKKTAHTFTLVHRAQNDPLIHDENAPAMVFAEKQTQQSRRPKDEDYAYSSAGSTYSGSHASYRSTKTKQREDLEDEFGLSFRPNEGEAAQHGVFFDDTEYNYMQHMRDLGEGSGTWVEGAQSGKKNKQSLDDALRSLDLDGRSQADDLLSVGTENSVARSLLPEEVLPSEFVKRRTYQDQQDIPDEIAGFQPDMDPRLREVLEALDDEAYVDDQDDDIFAQLTNEGYEVEKDEWERLGEQQMFEEGEGDLDDGWESDDTVRAASHGPQAKQVHLPDGQTVVPPPEDEHAQPPADPTGGAWLDEFKKFKSDAKAADTATLNVTRPAAMSILESSALSSLASGRRKKRKGALTSTTNYSMTSSALVRTAQQNLLDSRFDKIEEEYAMNELPDDEDSDINESMSMASGATGLSKASRASRYSNISGLSGVSGISSYSRASDVGAPQLVRGDFDGLMDEFLGAHSKAGKSGRRIKRTGPQSGMQQLDEIRSGLGPARVKSTTASR